MEGTAFRVLYREFLSRLVDREVLSVSAQGDASKLMGRFAAILILVSIPFTFSVIPIGDSRLPHQAVQVLAWGTEYSLIATTMLVVGIFAVLSWNSVFPDQRDVFVLAPLPIEARSIFCAKVASLAGALCLAIVIFNAAPGLLLPFALAPHEASILHLVFSLDFYRPLIAYWTAVFAAGAFTFCCVLSLQGIAAQLPRHLFLRVSAFLQMATFCFLVVWYFLQPFPASQALETIAGKLSWVPSYWFLGLFQQLNGSFDGAARPELVALAAHAWIGVSMAITTAGLVLLLSYLRTLRKIVEAPDILPVFRRLNWLPSLGNSIRTAVTHFSIRSLIRSRQHRLLLSFYMGTGFAIVILFVKTPVAQMLSAASTGGPWLKVTLPILASSFVMMCFWILGTRVAFGIPLELQANWIFRVNQIRADRQYFAASRWALYSIALGPVWTGQAVLFLCIWPWRPALEHMVVLVLLGTAIAELCLFSLRKVPFACSYLPGKTNLHITFLLGLMLGLNIIYWSAQFELRALADSRTYFLMIATLSVCSVIARWRTERGASHEILQFEEEAAPAITTLGLHSQP